MKTAQDVIAEIQELPRAEKQLVIDFVASIQEETFKSVDGSAVTEEWLLEEAELCRQRVDTDEHASVDGFCKSHGLT